MTSTSQVQGYFPAPANIWQIEAATRAARVTFRPEDYGVLGIYGVGQGNTTIPMSAGLSAASPVFSARWTHASNLALIKRITLSAAAGNTAFTAGIWKFDLFVGRSFSASDTAGTSILPVGNQNKMRTSGMGTTLFGDIRIAAAVTLSVGTRTLDSNPIASIAGGVTNVAGAVLANLFPLWDVRPGEHPLVLATNEGVVLQATVPATGTWNFSVKMDWTEIAAY